jgi:hypothetical protein
VIWWISNCSLLQSVTLRLLAALTGLAVLALVLTDAFNTIVLARRTRHIVRIARFYYKGMWAPVAAFGRRIRSSRGRESFLAVFAPLSLLFLFVLWAAALAFAFGLLQWAAGFRRTGVPETLVNDFYFSASTLSTLSSGDPLNTLSRWIAVLEGGIGLGFLGLVVGYLPVFYQSFSSRELTISLLDARSGSPPSAVGLLRATAAQTHQMVRQLEIWEQWASQVLENHLSYPMLAYFRSHHANQSWLTALVSIIDYAGVIAICSQGELKDQARFTVAMGRHVVADMASLFGLEKEFQAYRRKGCQRVSPEGTAGVAKVLEGSPLFDASLLTEQKLRAECERYEPEAAALGDYFLMSLPSWLPAAEGQNNWRVSVTEGDDAPEAVSDTFSGKGGKSTDNP